MKVAPVKADVWSAALKEPGASRWEALCQVACRQGARMTHLAECTWRARADPEE